MELTRNTKTIRLKVDGTNWTGAAGTSNLTSDEVDTQGFEGVKFTVGFGAIVSGAATSIKVRQGKVTGMSDGADLKGTSITVADTDDNKVVISEITHPEERFLDVVTLRATQNSTVDFVLAELFGPKDMPVVKDSTVATQEIFASPDEGTA